MVTLGIETSCDETSVAVLQDSGVLANIVSSQVAHTKFGGVVPEIAARNHIKVIVPLTRNALEVAGKDLRDVDLISVTRGPGLVGALLVGLSFAKSLAISLNKPLIGVNHLEGHIYGLQLGGVPPRHPYLVLIVSGGHTEIVLVREPFHYITLGRTLDDACGEAFDKVAKLMGLPYPGGPYIEKRAAKGKRGAIDFPVPRPDGLSFSYAGLKTAVLYYTRDNPRYDVNDVAANFQEVALEHLVEVAERAMSETGVKDLGLVGGVTVNRRLRDKFSALAENMSIHLHVSPVQFCTDNAAMIARAGMERFKRFGPSDLVIDVVARERLEDIT
ncbi:MAG: tRNA (adenosine(37)-N6)-threonylcarbamoyltransferase complex transferase subunit TsaD [candidate division WOR-3 bacterium]|nr:MAG: tRNA (adenosine(37)-N6)-threonylcarbamoyltransferase complex transferase subunit TsaD [candidate division WOR-3 bacterium]